MPPMSRPLITAWARISSMAADGSGFEQRRAGIRLWEHARQVAVLPLHADRVGVDVLAVGAEFDLAARTHGSKAGGHIERRERLAHLLRIGGLRAFQGVGDHEGL